jgi:hypothetical protein
MKRVHEIACSGAGFSSSTCPGRWSTPDSVEWGLRPTSLELGWIRSIEQLDASCLFRTGWAVPFERTNTISGLPKGPERGSGRPRPAHTGRAAGGVRSDRRRLSQPPHSSASGVITPAPVSLKGRSPDTRAGVLGWHGHHGRPVPGTRAPARPGSHPHRPHRRGAGGSPGSRDERDRQRRRRRHDPIWTRRGGSAGAAGSPASWRRCRTRSTGSAGSRATRAVERLLL